MVHVTYLFNVVLCKPAWGYLFNYLLIVKLTDFFILRISLNKMVGQIFLNVHFFRCSQLILPDNLKVIVDNCLCVALVVHTVLLCVFTFLLCMWFTVVIIPSFLVILIPSCLVEILSIMLQFVHQGRRCWKSWRNWMTRLCWWKSSCLRAKRIMH